MPLNVASLNEALDEHQPAAFVLQSYSQPDQTLAIAFPIEGGPRESDALVVSFLGAAVFHVPSVVHRSVRARVIPDAEAGEFVPAANFDASEFCDGGLTVVAFDDNLGVPTQYYVACNSVTWSWKRKTELTGVW